jgi:maleylacetate reductase
MNQFHYVGHAQEVFFGADSLAELSEAVDHFHRQRLMLCTTGSARRNGHVASIKAALGQRLAATYDHVRPHVPDFQVAEALALAVDLQVDAVIGLGGGSPIGLAKAVSLALEEKRTGRPARASYPTDQPLVPVIAIPTTYAARQWVSAQDYGD